MTLLYNFFKKLYLMDYDLLKKLLPPILITKLLVCNLPGFFEALEVTYLLVFKSARVEQGWSKYQSFISNGSFILCSGNLLRSGDIRGYQSMARMYTRLAAMPKKGWIDMHWLLLLLLSFLATICAVLLLSVLRKCWDTLYGSLLLWSWVKEPFQT